MSARKGIHTDDLTGAPVQSEPDVFSAFFRAVRSTMPPGRLFTTHQAADALSELGRRGFVLTPVPSEADAKFAPGVCGAGLGQSGGSPITCGLPSGHDGLHIPCPSEADAREAERHSPPREEPEFVTALCVVMPCCGFAFDAHHHDAEGENQWTCPDCSRTFVAVPLGRSSVLEEVDLEPLVVSARDAIDQLAAPSDSQALAKLRETVEGWRTEQLKIIGERSYEDDYSVAQAAQDADLMTFDLFLEQIDALASGTGEPGGLLVRKVVPYEVEIGSQVWLDGELFTVYDLRYGPTEEDPEGVWYRVVEDQTAGPGVWRGPVDTWVLAIPPVAA